MSPPGTVTVVIGPSGCGKSTLLGIMGGMLAATRRDGAKQHGAVAADCLNALTYVFQDFALLPWRSVAGNVALVLEGRPLPRGRDGREGVPAGACAAPGFPPSPMPLAPPIVGRHAPTRRHRPCPRAVRPAPAC